MAQEELTKVFKYIVKKCDMLINNGDYEADTYTQDTVEDIAELCNHVLDGDYGKLVEIKEVNLEKEITIYLGDNWKQDTPIEVQNDMISYAKYFFDLGFKARGGK